MMAVLIYEDQFHIQTITGNFLMMNGTEFKYKYINIHRDL